jgi:hypothetical protein
MALAPDPRLAMRSGAGPPWGQAAAAAWGLGGTHSGTFDEHTKTPPRSNNAPAQEHQTLPACAAPAGGSRGSRWQMHEACMTHGTAPADADSLEITKQACRLC